MDLHLSAGVIGLILAVLGHAGTTIWWGANMTSKLGTLNDNLNRIDKELEKRDTQISAIWKRLDEVRDLINNNQQTTVPK